VKCQTLNSLGHGVWAKVSSSKITLDDKKKYRLVKAEIDGITDRKKKSLAYDYMSDMMKLVSRAKINGYIPEGIMPHAKRLVDAETFWTSVEADGDDYPSFVPDIVDEVLTIGIKEAYNGVIDFDDQIYMSALFGGSFPQYPVVMVDEAQDLSPLNHEMLSRLKAGRLIAVGDPWQSIYGFRGAVTNGMQYLRSTFNMTELTLSVSFRCPKSVVRKAHGHVPHMRWADWAEEGEVTRLFEWNEKSIVDGSAIICRNNAPLLKLAFMLIRNGKGVELRGFDIGPSLVRALKKLGPETMDAPACYAAINRWEDEKVLKGGNGAAAAADRAECFRVFVDIGGSLAGAISYADSIFKARGNIQLLSGHKSKGLEWETVYHLDSWRIPSTFATSPEAEAQELNVRYVIETRAKRNLFLIDMKGYHE
jgi:hypothetical protein